MLEYHLDPSARIVAINGVWDGFARQNGGALAVRERVLGHQLWRFIDGPDTASFLNAIFFAAKRSGEAIDIPYRCDAPDLARPFRMTVIPNSEGLILRHRPIPIKSGVSRIGPGHDPARPKCSNCLTQQMPSRIETFQRYTVCRACKSDLENTIRHGDAPSARDVIPRRLQAV